MRAIRDLRDLVNVSRLTYHDDSENELENDFTNSIASLSINKSSSNLSKPVQNAIFKSSSSSNAFQKKPNSPSFSKLTPVDSKTTNNKNIYLLNSVNCSSSNMILRERDQLLDRKSVPLVHFSINSKKPLPPLKPAKTGEENKIDPVHDELFDETTENEFESIHKNRFSDGNFDEILTFIDASVVSDWLNRANRYLKKMLKWHQDNCDLYSPSKIKLLKYESFILFCNFWLGNNDRIKFNEKQRRNLIEMEYSIINEEVLQAFQVGLEAQSISVSDINHLLKAVFKEYPIQLLSFRGTYLILDFVDILCSDRDNEYKKLLSDVKCRTLNKQYAQWLLSIRSFSLISLCWGIVKFYRKTYQENQNTIKESNENKIKEFNSRLECLSASSNKKSQNSLKSSSHSSMSSIDSTQSDDSTTQNSNFVNNNNNRKSARLKSAKSAENALMSIHNKYELYLEVVYKNDLPDVLHYLISTKKIDPSIKDSQGRTLIFKAVMDEKPKILSYLVKRWPCIDINETCDSGNAPLHAAVNKGNLKLVEILLESLEHRDSTQNNDKVIQLDVDKPNPNCMNATALHLAVWNDYNEIAIKLVQNNADPYLKMNGETNAFDLARDNSNDVLHDLLIEYSNIKSSR